MNEIDELLDGLKEREVFVLARRFGLDGKEPETLASIGQTLGFDHESIRKIQNLALRKLRHPKRWQKVEFVYDLLREGRVSELPGVELPFVPKRKKEAWDATKKAAKKRFKKEKLIRQTWHQAKVMIELRLRLGYSKTDIGTWEKRENGMLRRFRTLQDSADPEHFCWIERSSFQCCT